MDTHDAVRVVIPIQGRKILHPKIVRQILDAIGQRD